MTRIITILIAALLSNTIFAFTTDAQTAVAQAAKREWNYSGNIYEVWVNSCTGLELVIYFSQPIADRLRLMENEKDSNPLMEQLRKLKYSKVYGINKKTMVTVTAEKGDGIYIALDEIMEILAKNSEKETRFVSAGEFKKYWVPCQTPEQMSIGH